VECWGSIAGQRTVQRTNEEATKKGLIFKKIMGSLEKGKKLANGVNPGGIGGNPDP